MSNFNYQSVDEQTVFFELPNTKGLKLKAIKRGDYSQPIVVIMHGRPGDGNELLPYLYARHLYEQGIASLRLFMYDFLKYTRNLVDCTLDTHANDFDAVVKKLREEGVTQIYGVGHSYGGLTILKASEPLDGAVLWDPTHGSIYQEEYDSSDYGEFPEKECGDFIVVPTGQGFIKSKSETDYNKQLGDTTHLAASKGYPLKVISAGKGVMAHLGKKYIDVADLPKEHIIIDEAHHQFEDSDDVVLRLFNESTDWLRALK